MISLCAPEHIPEIIDIVYDIWNVELPGYSDSVKHHIYAFLVQYYFTDPSLSFVYTENGAVQAFLFGGTAESAKIHNKTSEAFPFDRTASEPLSTLDEERLARYKSYVQTNSAAVHDEMKRGDACIGLFASRKSGVGSKLLAHFEDVCAHAGLQRIVLWTDQTCNVQYYYKKSFTEIMRFQTPSFLANQELSTLIFEKKLEART